MKFINHEFKLSPSQLQALEASANKLSRVIFNCLMSLRETRGGGSMPQETAATNPVNDVMNLDDAAKYLNVSKSYIYKLTSRRDIPHYKSKGGKLLYFKREELETWMTAKRVATCDELRRDAVAESMKGGAL